MQRELYKIEGNVAKHVHGYAEKIVEAIVTAEALAGTATYYDTNACGAWVGVYIGCRGDHPLNPSCCDASAVGDTFIQSINAVATAVARPPPPASKHASCTDLPSLHCVQKQSYGRR